MKRCVVCLVLGVVWWAAPLVAGAEEGRVFTLWPLLDYRRSDAVDYTSLNALGPFFNYERKGKEREYGLRPFYFHAEDSEAQVGYSEYLYPVATRKREPGLSLIDGLHLFQYDFGEREKGSDNEFTLFPFLFYGETAESGEYFALFPIGGKIYERFGRDEIRFALFPLYSQTRKKATTVTNLLWPIFARVSGEQESGIKVWPLFGYSDKTGVYRKRFYLWPVFFSYDLRLDTENPVSRRAVFPFFIGEESPQLSSRTVLWPFFSYREDRRRDYEEWNFPWPLFRIAHGRDREGVRFLPFFADEQAGAFRKRWYVWPLYKIEETGTESLTRRRDRVLYFLYSDLEETVHEEGSPRKRRVALWPLFTYEQLSGVSRFHTFSLLEPFFPENLGIERNWSPLWRLYQRKWDKHGNEVSSLLWNLYWKERRGSDLAMEVFPLFSYSRQDRQADLRLLKGLVRYQTNHGERTVRLFYLPWGISWTGQDAQRAEPAEGLKDAR